MFIRFMYRKTKLPGSISSLKLLFLTISKSVFIAKVCKKSSRGKCDNLKSFLQQFRVG